MVAPVRFFSWGAVRRPAEEIARGGAGNPTHSLHYYVKGKRMILTVMHNKVST
jgi:hypothetical protein